MEKRPKVLIVCGEPSGDAHAAALVRALKARRPGVEFFGAGGPKLKAEGVELLYDLTAVAVVGFFEVLKHLKTFRQVFDLLLREAAGRRPDVAVLLDYPGFNLALAKKLKAMGIPVVYYISPQVWAWGKGRIKAIRRDIDRMLVILPFEKDFYEKEGVAVSFVGHPAIDSVRASVAREDFLAGIGLDPAAPVISLLPGSREKEVRSLLPAMLGACRIVDRYMPPGKTQFVILRSSAVPESVFASCLAQYPGLKVSIATGRTYDGIAASDFALVCSGTATLETGILGTPMVILYRVHLLTWLYIRLLIRIPFIGLVNIVKGKKVMEELIQFDCTPQRIADEVLRALKDGQRMEELRRELRGIRESLGEPGASDRAAEEVIKFIK